MTPKTIWTNLLMFFSWIIIPPVFIFLIARNRVLTKKKKNLAYISVLLSPVTLIVLLVAFILIYDSLPKRFSIKNVEKDLNISLVKPYEVELNNTDQIDWQDFTATVIISFEEESFNKVEQQILESKYFNLYQDFYGNNTIKWAESDTDLYWEVRNYLEANKLTGYWVREDSLTYVFFEPNLSDIPNSAILFNKGYMIRASLSKENLKLYYQYIGL